MSQAETVVLGGGCFWCLEAVYERMQGVLSVESGYMGGRTPNPTYHDVCSGATGHAEVVKVTFDPAVTSYREILKVFFTIHDPTTPNRQGNDVGTQYRSVIFYGSGEQKQAPRKSFRKSTRPASGKTRSSPKSRLPRLSIAPRITIRSISATIRGSRTAPLW